MEALGKHCLLELYDCPSSLLDDHEFILTSLQNAAASARATWLGHVSHRFDPQGVTALGLLAESHISMHTWPERGYAAVDVFTCGDVAMPSAACRHLIEVFEPGRHDLRELPRGLGAACESPNAAFVGA